MQYILKYIKPVIIEDIIKFVEQKPRTTKDIYAYYNINNVANLSGVKIQAVLKYGQSLDRIEVVGVKNGMKLWMKKQKVI